MEKKKRVRLREPKREITVDHLARMVEHGFEGTHRVIVGEAANLSEQMRKGFGDVLSAARNVDEHVADVWEAVNRIEKHLLENHEHRLKRIEAKLGF